MRNIHSPLLLFQWLYRYSALPPVIEKTPPFVTTKEFWHLSAA